MRRQNWQSCNSGFTLIEVLLVISIMAFMSVMVTVSYTSTVDQLKFKAVYNKIEDMIFDTRKMALHGKKIPDCTDYDSDSDVTEEVVAAGYGLNAKFASNAYYFTIFSDMHGFSSGYFNVSLVSPAGAGGSGGTRGGGSGSSGSQPSCSDVSEERYVMPAGFSVTINGSMLSSNQAYNFMYSPPDATFTAHNEIGNPVSSGTYVIRVENAKFYRDITLTSSGVPSRGNFTTK